MTISVEQAHPVALLDAEPVSSTSAATSGYILSAMVKGLPGEGARRLERRYFGYTLAEARAHFCTTINDNGGIQ